MDQMEQQGKKEVISWNYVNLVLSVEHQQCLETKVGKRWIIVGLNLSKLKPFKKIGHLMRHNRNVYVKFPQTSGLKMTMNMTNVLQQIVGILPQVLAPLV